MKKIIYYTPEEVLNLVYIGKNGKVLISKGSLLNMIKRGAIPAEQLGMKRRYFIPEYRHNLNKKYPSRESGTDKLSYKARGYSLSGADSIADMASDSSILLRIILQLMP